MQWRLESSHNCPDVVYCSKVYSFLVEKCYLHISEELVPITQKISTVQKTSHLKMLMSEKYIQNQTNSCFTVYLVSITQSK